MDLQELKQHILSHIEVLKLNQEQLTFQQGCIQQQILDNLEKLFKLENQLNIVSNEPELIISIKDWLPECQYKEYYPQITMLFEEGINIQNWLSWFYEELPFIKDKHLSFIGRLTGKSYLSTELTGLVKVDKKNQIIYSVEGEPVIITLGSVNLFKLLSMSNYEKE